MLFFVSSFFHLLILCFIIAIYAQISSRQSAVNNSRKRAPKLTYTSWVKLRSVMRRGWARNELESALMENRLNAFPQWPCFVKAFWFVIHVCDSSFEKSLERKADKFDFWY